MPTPYTGSIVYPASYNIPSDGDERDATSVNAALEALGDRTTYLKARTGAINILQGGGFTGSGSITSTSPVQLQSNVPADEGYLDVPNCLAGDLLHIQMEAAQFVSQANIPDAAETRLYLFDDFGGPNEVTYIGPGTVIHQLHASAHIFQCIHLSWIHTVVEPGTCRASYYGQILGATGARMNVNAGNIIVFHLRG